MLRKQMLALLLLFLAPLIVEAADIPGTSLDQANLVWAIWNSRARAEFQLTQEGVFRLVSLSAPDGKSWSPPAEAPLSPISVRIDNLTLDESVAWSLVESSEQQAPRNGRRWAITLRSDALQVEVVVNLEMHPHQPFLRYWLAVKNNAEQGRFINVADILHWRLDTGGQPVRAFYVNQYMTGLPFMFDLNEVDLPSNPGGATLFSGAHALHCSWLALSTTDKPGIVAGWEFDGRAHVTSRQARAGDPLEIVGGPDALHVPLGPGKSLTLPAAFLGLFQGDWDEAGYRTQRYVEAVLAQPIPDDNFPYVMYDTWGYETDFNEALLRQAAQVAAAVGVEVFVVDMGWARQLGEWTEDQLKFPSGLRAFSDYVHSLGMKFGLHWVPVQADPGAPVLGEHPNWTATEFDDYFGSLSLCLGDKPVQDWARQTVLDLVERYRVDWLSQDAENLVKECRKTTHSHDPLNSNWANSVNGIDALVKYARQKAPNLLWENNADGGNMLTFESVKRYVTAGSCDACEDTRRRQAVHGMSYPFPPRYIDRYMTDPPNSWTLRSSMFGGPLIFMQPITRWTPSEIEVVRDEVAVYKSLRKLVRDGKVFHLNSPTSSDYAIESYDESGDRAVVFVYRSNWGLSRHTVHPRGLRADRTYRVTFQNDGRAGSATGAQLKSRGIPVNLPTANFAEIVYITPVQ